MFEMRRISCDTPCDTQNKALDVALTVGNSAWNSDHFKHFLSFTQALPFIQHSIWFSRCTLSLLSWTYSPQPFRGFLFHTRFASSVAGQNQKSLFFFSTQGHLYLLCISAWTSSCQLLYCNIVRVAPASAVGKIFLWNNPADPKGGMPGKEKRWPREQSLERWRHHTQSLSHPIHPNMNHQNQIGPAPHP